MLGFIFQNRKFHFIINLFSSRLLLCDRLNYSMATSFYFNIHISFQFRIASQSFQEKLYFKLMPVCAYPLKQIHSWTPTFEIFITRGNIIIIWMVGK